MIPVTDPVVGMATVVTMSPCGLANVSSWAPPVPICPDAITVRFSAVFPLVGYERLRGGVNIQTLNGIEQEHHSSKYIKWQTGLEALYSEKAEDCVTPKVT